VEWRQILIAAIYSSSEDGFILFGVATKQATAIKTLPNILQAEVARLLPNPPFVSGLRSSGDKLQVM